MGERVREVAGGQEEHVAAQLLGAAAHELAEGAVLGVGPDDREATRCAAASRKLSGTRTPWSSTSPSSGTMRSLRLVAGQRKQELRELDVVVVSEGGLRAAEAAEVAARRGAVLTDVGVAEAVGCAAR